MICCWITALLSGIFHCNQKHSEFAQGLRHQVTEQMKQVMRLTHLKHPEFSHYSEQMDKSKCILWETTCFVRNVRSKVYESANKGSPGSAIKVKQNSFQHSITKKKVEVEAEHLMPFVVMPEGVTSTLKSWWETIPSEHEVDI